MCWNMDLALERCDGVLKAGYGALERGNAVLELRLGRVVGVVRRNGIEVRRRYRWCVVRVVSELLLVMGVWLMSRKVVRLRRGLEVGGRGCRWIAGVERVRGLVKAGCGIREVRRLMCVWESGVWAEVGWVEKVMDSSRV